MRDQKLHAVVAQSTFSRNADNITDLNFGSAFKIQMLQKCELLWCEAPFERDIDWKAQEIPHLSEKWAQREGLVPVAVSNMLACAARLERIWQDACPVAGVVQETCSSEMLRLQGLDFLPGVACWSVRSSGLLRWSCQGTAVCMTCAKGMGKMSEYMSDMEYIPIYTNILTSDRMPEYMTWECQIECPNVCQIECQIGCHKICEIECPIDRQKDYRNICQNICSNMCWNVMMGITQSKVYLYLLYSLPTLHCYMLEVSIIPSIWSECFDSSNSILLSSTFHQEKSRKISADGDFDEKMQWSQHMIHEMLAMCFAWTNRRRQVKMQGPSYFICTDLARCTSSVQHGPATLFYSGSGPLPI